MNTTAEMTLLGWGRTDLTIPVYNITNGIVKSVK